MPLPNNFSPWEHLQNVLRQVQNRIVRDEFFDIGDDDWEPEIITPRGSLRLASTLRDEDSAITTLIRLMFFYIVIRKAKDLAPPIYGLPVTAYQEHKVFKPQIQLYFQEDALDVEEGYAPMTGEISVRIMNRTEETITESELRAFGVKIKSLFGAGNGFRWHKGKVMCAYTDKVKGYQLQILAFNEAEGKRVIEQVLDIQSDTPDWKYLNVNQASSPAERHPTIPPTKNILAKARRMPRSRPVGYVRFRHALAHIYGLKNPVVLYDRENVYFNPLVKD